MMSLHLRQIPSMHASQHRRTHRRSSAHTATTTPANAVVVVVAAVHLTISICGSSSKRIPPAVIAAATGAFCSRALQRSLLDFIVSLQLIQLPQHPLHFPNPFLVLLLIQHQRIQLHIQINSLLHGIQRLRVQILKALPMLPLLLLRRLQPPPHHLLQPLLHPLLIRHRRQLIHPIPPHRKLHRLHQLIAHHAHRTRFHVPFLPTAAATAAASAAVLQHQVQIRVKPVRKPVLSTVRHPSYAFHRAQHVFFFVRRRHRRHPHRFLTAITSAIADHQRLLMPTRRRRLLR
mmetsp:Transcript_15614/g.33689  ORF Transcript_15614/g.33689 Transcript_15614/m.33689 type:complete len:289 (+) Transcript_15614:424-1290(+)